MKKTKGTQRKEVKVIVGLIKHSGWWEMMSNWDTVEDIQSIMEYKPK